MRRQRVGTTFGVLGAGAFFLGLKSAVRLYAGATCIYFNVGDLRARCPSILWPVLSCPAEHALMCLVCPLDELMELTSWCFCQTCSVGIDIIAFFVAVAVTAVMRSCMYNAPG